jgi:hypothetical protein
MLIAFLTEARRLEGKLACCLLQFGYFNRKAFASLDVFQERIDPLSGSLLLFYFHPAILFALNP